MRPVLKLTGLTLILLLLLLACNENTAPPLAEANETTLVFIYTPA